MKRTIRLISQVAWLELCVVALVAQTTSARPKPVISLTISSLSPLKAGSSVPIHIELRNVSDHNIVIIDDVRGTDCRIEVHEANGRVVPDTKFGLLYNGHARVTDTTEIDPEDLKGALVSILIKRGGKWDVWLDVTKFYAMRNPGKFSIFVEKVDPEHPELPAVKSNTVVVTTIR